MDLFYQRVSEEGYRWIDTRDGRAITDGLPFGSLGIGHEYNPFKRYPALFLNFAETEISEADIQRFADKYGPLGVFRKIPGEELAPETPFRQELFSTWEVELLDMKRAVGLWNALRAHDIETLRQKIKVENGKAEYVGDTGKTAVPRVVSDSRAYRAALTPEDGALDVGTAALLYIQQLINHRLEQYVSERLLWSEKTGRLARYTFPKNSAGVLWLQLANAITKETDYRRCPECGSWFEVSPEGARVTRLYCSEACRARAYRKRQAEARRLAAEGLSAEEIAERLGSDAKTVEGWIK